MGVHAADGRGSFQRRRGRGRVETRTEAFFAVAFAAALGGTFFTAGGGGTTTVAVAAVAGKACFGAALPFSALASRAVRAACTARTRKKKRKRRSPPPGDATNGTGGAAAGVGLHA